MSQTTFTLVVAMVTVLSKALGAASVEEWVIPSTTASYEYCRPGNSLSLAHCLNWMANEKQKKPQLTWRVTIQPGSYVLKETILLLNVSRLEIRGRADGNGAFPELHASGLPSNRLAQQYFSVILMNAKDVSFNQLRFLGENLPAQRAIGICSTPGSESANIKLTGLELRDYPFFTVIAGNAPAPENFATLATYDYGTSSNPMKNLVTFIKQLAPSDRYCGGSLRNIAFSSNVVYMKSVGFYLAPPIGNFSSSLAVESPTGRSKDVPSWYAQSKQTAQRYSGIVIDKNKFINDLFDAEQAKENQYHSAMKLHWSTGTRITNNIIDATGLPKAFESGAAINIAAGVFDALIQQNRITLPAGLKNPFGINLLSTYLQHDRYGWGDKHVFGAVSGIVIRANQLENAVIRFMDCCVQVENSDPDTRPFCEQRDQLIQAGFQERISLENNASNGVAKMDYNLIWRTSRRESAWLKHYEEREAQGQGGVYCRKYMGVGYLTKDGAPRSPRHASAVNANQ